MNPTNKKYKNGWEVWLDDLAGINISGPDVYVRFWPFPIRQKQEFLDHYRYDYNDKAIYPANSLEFTLEDDSTWHLGIQTPAMHLELSNVPIEMREDLVYLCNTFHDNHAISPQITERR